jgi:ABC-2 type transport system permease protein
VREVAILVRRELTSYFASPIAYVFGALFLLVQGYLTVPSILTNGQPASMETFFGMLPMMFLLFVPPLTMRLWAEERKLGTIELLMTFPVTVSKLIVSKFVAALVFLALVMALTLGLPATLMAYGDLDVGPVLCAYLASLLLAGSYLAVGMFCSSLTRDQLVAMLVALVLLLTLTMIGHPGFQVAVAGSVPNWLLSFLGAVSPLPYFGSITRGIVDTRDIVFYVCFCGFFLHMNALVLQGRRLRG